MEYRAFGNTGLEVSRLGVGMSELGFELSMKDIEQASRVLNSALDHGINLLDTAACYGIAEELIGRCVSGRRDDFILSTKCGHVPTGYKGEDWTAKTVAESVDRSLERMKTDHIDIVHLHSCSVEILERGEVIGALQAAKRAGKTRLIAYSGDNDAVEWAVRSGLFDSIQTSINLVDQRARTRVLPAALKAGLGVIAKRPIANGVWQAEESPSEYAAAYFERATAMLARGTIEHGWNEEPHPVQLALGYVLSLPGVSTAIIGTKNPAHMITNIQHLASISDFSTQIVEELNRRFDTLGADWPQLT
ncbi:MAG TPA: aldo/keto reductase [Spirochaetia bacterium]|nr:aldo/keto reductase [Spirochaetia bacterium]